MLAGRRRQGILLAPLGALGVLLQASPGGGDEGLPHVVDRGPLPVADVEGAGGLAMADYFFHSGFGHIASAGAGVDVMVTVLPNGLVPHLEDRVFLTDGLWFVRGLGCGLAFGQSSATGIPDYNAQRTQQVNSPDCYASYALMPVALQWSIAFGQRWNVFTEAGAALFAKTSAPACTPGTECSSNRGIFPTMELGLRYAFDPSAAVVLRLGFPMVTLGVAAM